MHDYTLGVRNLSTGSVREYSVNAIDAEHALLLVESIYGIMPLNVFSVARNGVPLTLPVLADLFDAATTRNTV